LIHSEMKKVIGLVLLVAAVLAYAFIPVDSKKTIVIDAGHGGKDPGVQIEELLEKEIVQNIALKIKEFGESPDCEVVLLREDDSFMSLADRVARVNALQPDLMLSLHVNQSDNAAANGIEMYVSKENAFYEASKREARRLSAEMEKGLLEMRGIKEANFFVLKNSEAPALLLDMGFLSNSSDKEYITSESGQEQLALLISNYLRE